MNRFSFAIACISVTSLPLLDDDGVCAALIMAFMDRLAAAGPSELGRGGAIPSPYKFFADTITDFNQGGRLCPTHYSPPGFTDLPKTLWKLICVSFSLFWFCSDIISFITLHGRDLWTGYYLKIYKINTRPILNLIWAKKGSKYRNFTKYLQYASCSWKYYSFNV